LPCITHIFLSRNKSSITHRFTLSIENKALGEALENLKKVEQIRALTYGNADHHTIVVDHYVKAQIKHALGDKEEKYDIAFKAFQMAVNLSENQTVKKRYINEIQRLILEMVSGISSHYRDHDRVSSSEPLKPEVIEEIKKICEGGGANAGRALAEAIKKREASEQPTTDTQKALFFELFNIIALDKGFDTYKSTAAMNLALNIAPEAARDYPQFFLNGRVVDHYIKTLQDAGKHSEAELIREKVQYQKTVEK
jgi:hypothetical protein